MKIKLLAVILSYGFACSATAGLFSSSDDEEKAPFKCGRADAISALISSMKDEAVPKLISTYGTPTSTDKKAQYKTKLMALPVTISGVSTTSESGNSLNCIATINVKVPTELNELANKTPHVYASYIQASHAIDKNGELAWKNIHYSIMLSDNGKDISVDTEDMIATMDTLAKSATLAVDKDDILKLYDPKNVDLAKSDFTVVDNELNKIWKAIPPSFRTSMKFSQVDWIYQKESQCGTIQQANNNSVSVLDRVQIFKCQTSMTKERIKYLGGGNYN